MCRLVGVFSSSSCLFLNSSRASHFSSCHSDSVNRVASPSKSKTSDVLVDPLIWDCQEDKDDTATMIADMIPATMTFSAVAERLRAQGALRGGQPLRL